MSEIVVETTPSETVIEIEGGPTLTTTVATELQTVIETPAEPVVIDLNSGARGEPGSAILTGPAYPTLLDGSVGDIYIITEGSTGSGDVYTKTSAGWVKTGNIRGPAGGINKVNGYTGPDVVLVKGDIGLANVDNTNDLAKPISTATQTALNLKANDNAVVHLAGSENITGVKTFSAMPIHNTVTGDLLNSHLIAQNVPMFHDRFRFTQPVWSTSTDGTTFTDSGSNGWSVLDGRSDGGVSFSDAARFQRWYWNSTHDIQYGNLTRLVTRWGYTVATATSAIITVESSANGTAWTVRGTATVNSPNTKQHIMQLADNGGDNHFRVTIEMVGSSGSPIALLNSLEVQAYRYGSQGKGFEAEVPYWWNHQREFGLYNSVRVMAATNTIDLGSSPTRFRDGYFAGNVYASNLVDIASTQTITGPKTIATSNGASLLTVSQTGAGYASANAAIQINSDNPAGTNIMLRTSLVGTGTFSVRADGLVTSTAGFSGPGGSLTALNGTNISTGTVADARLSTNVALLTGTQTFSGAKTFTSTVIVPTPTADTHASTKKYVDDQIFILTNGSPALLNTLDELAAALGDDPNFATTMTNSLATKVDLTSAQTISGVKTFTADIYTSRIRGYNNGYISTYADRALGTTAGNATITRQHESIGSNNTFKIIDLMHRRAAGSDWTTAQHYMGIGVDTSFLDSPTTGASPLRTWIMRDPQNQTLAFGSSANTYFTLTSAAATAASGVVFTGNGSGLTTLNGSNVSSGTIADARLSTNVAKLDANQKFTGQNWFQVAVGARDFSARALLIHNNSASGGTVLAFQRGLSGEVILLTHNSANEFEMRNGNDDGWVILRAGAVYDNGNRVYSASNAPTPAQVGFPAAANIVYRVVHTGTTWPARPSGATYVEWVGPTAPAAATANDTWVNTTV